jgi:hypothetical protein
MPLTISATSRLSVSSLKRVEGWALGSADLSAIRPQL